MSKSPYFQVYKYGSECRRCNHDCKNDPDKPCPFFELNESYKPERKPISNKQYSQRIYWDAFSLHPSASDSISLGGSGLTFDWMDTNSCAVAGTG